MPDPHPIVQELRRIRRDSKLSQGALANTIGINQNSIAYRETGRVSPLLSHLSAWAEALGYELALRPKDGKG